MAATRWFVALSGTAAFDATSSWSASDGGTSGASVPVSGDTAIINRGSASIPGGDFSAVVLASLTITAPVSIGSVASPFKIGLANPAAMSIVCSVSGDQGDVYLAPVHAGANCITRLASSGNVVISGATSGGTLMVARGSVSVSPTFDGAAWTVVTLGGTVRMDAGASTAPTVDAQGGSVLSARSVGAMSLSDGGRSFLTGTAAATSVTVHAHSMHLHLSSGTIGTMTVKTNGVASCSGNPSPFVVTSSAAYGNGKLFEDALIPVVYTITPLLAPSGDSGWQV